MLGTGLTVGVALVAFGWLAWLTYRLQRKSEPPQPQPPKPMGDSAAMSPAGRSILITYLFFVGLVLGYLIVTLHYVDVRDLALAPETTAKVEIKGAAPTILRVTAGPRVGSDKIALAITGQNFVKATTKLRLNAAVLNRDVEVRDDKTINASVDPAAIGNLEAIIIDVVNAEAVSNAVEIAVVRPTGNWAPFGFRLPVTREIQLILLVLLAGALGSFVHAIQSLVNFIGNRTLLASWFWWYFTRPFFGMAMAFIFYAVLRGGFLAGTPADAKTVNPFGVIAIAALTGMFADRAALKLSDVWNTMFKTDEVRGGKLADPVLTGVDPGIIWVGATQPVLIVMTGNNLSKVESVHVNGDPRKPDSTGDTQIKLHLKTTDVAKAGRLEFSLVGPDGKSVASKTVELMAPDFSTDPQPPATAPNNKAYRLAIKPIGGSTPFAFVTQTAGWSIDKSGTLSGTPTTVGPLNIDVSVTDASGAGVTKTVAIGVT